MNSNFCHYYQLDGKIIEAAFCNEFQFDGKIIAAAFVLKLDINNISGVSDWIFHTE